MILCTNKSVRFCHGFVHFYRVAQWRDCAPLVFSIALLFHGLARQHGGAVLRPRLLSLSLSSPPQAQLCAWGLSSHESSLPCNRAITLSICCTYKKPKRMQCRVILVLSTCFGSQADPLVLSLLAFSSVAILVCGHGCWVAIGLTLFFLSFLLHCTSLVS